MPASSRLPDFQDRAPRDRYCDLILTGGVTSAIAYPAAIFALATTYRFNAIGGSSSGAGAAALAAAAEFRRRHGSSDGFRILLERTEALAEDVEGRSGLAWLFQPAPRNRRLFEALLAAVAPPAGRRTGGFAPLLPYLGSLVAGVAIACLIVWLVSLTAPQGWMAYAATAVIGGAAAIGFSIRRDLVHMVDGDYGLCSGMDRQSGAPHPTLVEWLHDLIQEIAGLRRGAPPLTFADLASAPGSPRETLGDLSPGGAVSIGLQMFTANINHGRPYVLPQIDSDPALYFRVVEMRGLFPESVVDHMKRHSTRYDGDATIADAPVSLRGRHGGPPGWELGRKAATASEDDALRLLPREQLPIVVAARLSVSFPVLFSAVPLWVLDRHEKRTVMRRCLFSDGGLCSNFPIHLFDSPVPAWPTFGISLHEMQDAPECEAPAGEHDTQIRNAVHLPQDHRDGHADRWIDFAHRRSGGGRLIGFLGALLSTTKDWNDATLSRLPGVRERVAQVGLPPGFGGLNILMTPEQIRHLGELGGEAGRRLLERFATPSGPGGVADGWSEHRWVRFNVLQDCLSRSLSGLTWAASRAPYGVALRVQIRGAVDDPPLAPDDGTRLLPAQAAALESVLAALMQAERSLTAPTAEQPYQPYPRPELRVRPPL